MVHAHVLGVHCFRDVGIQTLALREVLLNFLLGEGYRYLVALCSVACEYDHELVLLDAAVVNARQRKRVIAKLQRKLHTLKGKRVALLGAVL